MLRGEISAVDIFRVLPYGGSVFKVRLVGSLLQKVLDYGENSAGRGAYLQRYNVNKIQSNWFIDGKKIKEDAEYTVAFSDYLMRGLDIPFLNEKNKEVLGVYKPLKKEIAYDIRNTVITYLRSL